MNSFTQSENELREAFNHPSIKPDANLCATTTRTATHPRTNVNITFTFDTHNYSTPTIPHFTSGTTLVKHFFEPFNAPEVAARCAAKRGVSTESLLAEWEAKRNESSTCGTRTHETAEALLQNLTPPHSPRHDRERAMFAAAYDAVHGLRAQGFVFSEAEKIVFSEGWVIAGMIDLTMYHPGTGVAWILDWKTNESIEWTDPYKKKGLGCLSHLPDCNAVHYALQLSLYQWLLVTEGYISPNVPINRALIHLTPEGPRWLPVPYLGVEVKNMVREFWECPF